MDPEAAVRAHGGVATIRDLQTAGIHPSRIRRLARTGRLLRVREGVYAVGDCDPLVLRAAQLGGRLAGASAARHLGVWAPPSHDLVIEVPRGTHVDAPPDVRVIRGRAGPRRYGCSAPGELVVQILRTEPPAFAIATIDSMLRTGAVAPDELAEIAGQLPGRLRKRLDLIDARAESGTESVVRVALALDGIDATPQTRIPFRGAQRVDLLVGDRLVIECDSREHHSTPEQLDRDSDRDLHLQALGYLVIRVRYRTAMFDLDSVIAAVRRYVDEGLHLDGSAPFRRDTP